MKQHDATDGGMRIREATVDDLSAINAIYNHYVLNCTCTWQERPETDAGRRAWFDAHGAGHPVTVAECGGRIAGWGSLSAFGVRSAYRHTVEDSIYVHPESLGRGVGSALLADLLSRAEAIGHHSIVAVISGDRAGSMALHAKFGFVLSGTLKEAGFKFGRWLDAVHMQKIL